MTTHTLKTHPAAASLPRVPAADVFESDAEIRILIDVPGVGPEALDLTVEGDELRLTTTGDTIYHRRFQLPDVVDSQHIEASVRDGVVTLSLPKVPAARPRKLEVRAA